MTRQMGLYLLIVCLFFLSPANAQETTVEYHEVMRLGRGQLSDIEWNPNGELLAAASSLGIWLYTSDLQDAAHLELTQCVESMRWSPDGDWLAVQLRNDDEQSIWQIYDVSAGEFVRVMENHSVIEDVLWSPDNSELTIAEAETIYLFDATTKQEIAAFDGLLGSWSPDNSLLAIVNPDQIQLLDASTFEPIEILADEESGLQWVLWSPDSLKLAAVGDNRVLVWDVTSGELVSILVSEIQNSWSDIRPESVLREGIITMAWNQDSRRLAIGYQHPVISPYGQLQVWDITTGGLLTSQNMGLRYRNIEWSLDNTNLMVIGIGGSSYPYSYFLDTITWQEILPNIYDTRWVINPNQDVVAGFHHGSEGIRFYNPYTFEVQTSFNGHMDLLRDAEWNPDGRVLGIASGDEIQLWDFANERVIASNNVHLGAWATVIGWSTDSQYLAVASSTIKGRHSHSMGTVHIWNTETQTPVSIVRDQQIAVGDARWSPYEANIATVDYGFPPTIRVASAITGNPLLIVDNAHEGPMYSVDWSSDGSKFVTSGHDKTIRIWNATTGEMLLAIESSAWVATTDWNPIHDFIASVSLDEASAHPTLNIWDALTGEPLLTLEVGGRQLGWSPDGSMLAVSGQDGTVDIGVVEFTDNQLTLDIVYKLSSTDIILDRFFWHPNNHRVATIGRDSNYSYYLQFWDLENPETPETVFAMNDYVYFVNSFAWHPNGEMFAFTQNEGVVHIWEEDR